MDRSTLKFLFLSLALIALPTLAQETNTSAAGIPGCGDPSAKFEVKISKDHPPVQPQPGKALVYFIQNDSSFNSIPKPTTRIGIDGKWVGATGRNSYLDVFVDPGVRHLCASWQRHVIMGRSLQTAAAHFTAQAGGVYYFQIKDTYLMGEGNGVINDVKLSPLDSDEGQLLANQYAHATSHPKK